jgi:dihydrolipoamide dehydrogenase
LLALTIDQPLNHHHPVQNVGVKLDNRGRVAVDDHFRSNVPSIYAIGDCIPGPMLAHKAEEDGIAAVEIIAGTAVPSTLQP